MRPVTDSVPKALITVAGRPFVDLQLEWLAGEGVERAVFCVGYKGALLREHVLDGRRFGLTVEYVDEGAVLRGTGGALRLALDQGALPEVFLVLYGDSYLRVALRAVWSAFEASGAPALMTVFRNRERWEQSNARYTGGEVTLYDKSESRPPDLEYVDYGLSVLTRDLVEQEIPSATFFDLADLYGRLSSVGRLAGFEVHDRFYEIGSPQGLADLEAHVLETARQQQDRHG